jgi:hypothetical protein
VWLDHLLLAVNGLLARFYETQLRVRTISSINTLQVGLPCTETRPPFLLNQVERNRVNREQGDHTTLLSNVLARYRSHPRIEWMRHVW